MAPEEEEEEKKVEVAGEGGGGAEGVGRRGGGGDLSHNFPAVEKNFVPFPEAIVGNVGLLLTYTSPHNHNTTSHNTRVDFKVRRCTHETLCIFCRQTEPRLRSERRPPQHQSGPLSAETHTHKHNFRHSRCNKNNKQYDPKKSPFMLFSNTFQHNCCPDMCGLLQQTTKANICFNLTSTSNDCEYMSKICSV